MSHFLSPFASRVIIVRLRWSVHLIGFLLNLLDTHWLKVPGALTSKNVRSPGTHKQEANEAVFSHLSFLFSRPFATTCYIENFGYFLMEFFA